MKSVFIVAMAMLFGTALLIPSIPVYAEEDGAALFKKQKRYKCHGKEAQGSKDQGPQLKGGKFMKENSDEEIKKVILNGRVGKDKKYKEYKKKMPKFEGKLNDQELDTLLKFLKEEPAS